MNNVHRLSVNKITKSNYREADDILLESIRKNGLQKPIIVNKRRDVLSGNRRLDAVKKLGRKTIRAYIQDREVYEQTGRRS